MDEIKKMIIPVAGLGTRFFPLSLVLSKEFFPLVDKPVIQYIAEEAKKSGIKEIVFVVSSKQKKVLEYFNLTGAFLTIFFFFSRLTFFIFFKTILVFFFLLGLFDISFLVTVFAFFLTKTFFGFFVAIFFCTPICFTSFLGLTC